MNLYDDNEEAKFNKQLTVKICEVLYSYRCKYMSNLVCSNTADVHFSLPTPRPTRRRKHCWLACLLGLQGAVTFDPLQCALFAGYCTGWM